MGIHKNIIQKIVEKEYKKFQHTRKISKAEKIMKKIDELDEQLNYEALNQFHFSFWCPVCNRNLNYDGVMVNMGEVASESGYSADCYIYKCNRCGIKSIWIYGIMPAPHQISRMSDYMIHHWEWERPFSTKGIYGLDHHVKYTNKSRHH